MNSATAQMVSDAQDTIAPEPEIVINPCIATPSPMGPDHYDCDPVTCDEAAWMRAAGMTDDDFIDERYFDADEPCDCSHAYSITHRPGASGCDANITPITFIGA